MNIEGDEVAVVFVNRSNAKLAKDVLNSHGLLYKDYRLSVASCLPDCIAVPLVNVVDVNGKVSALLHGLRIEGCGFGRHFCQYSSSICGNRSKIKHPSPLTDKNPDITITLVQSGLLDAFSMCWEKYQQANTIVIDRQRRTNVEQKVLELDLMTCPKTFQYLGDDRTVVIPLRSFDIDRDEAFVELILFGVNGLCPVTDSRKLCEYFVEEFLWQSLAKAFHTSRLVRRGVIDPDSGVRLSEYKILWIDPNSYGDSITNKQLTTLLGPDSPGWITVTENGIRQSFDLTKVMFSRGNITEKQRFGELVQPGEIVLDLYAGIGYFTLPALVYGGAEFVYCCEWNDEAVRSLHFNLRDNGVSNRAKVLVGDCRKLCVEHNLVDMFDRVSLGLLPSSEGGWRTAVRALRRSTGGWLHVHGNVPAREMEHWALWLSSQLNRLVHEEEVDVNKLWCVIVVHVEKVKSFAPTVNHYVADVVLGPPKCIQVKSVKHSLFSLNPGTSGVLLSSGELRMTYENVLPPSCALSTSGKLNQEWMREPIYR